MYEQTKHERRCFLGIAVAAATAAAELGVIHVASAQSSIMTSQHTRGSKPATGFTSLKQIDAGELSVGYAELGPPDGPPVILLHGWPYDIYAYVDVVPILMLAGYRVIIPYLRGFAARTT